MLGALVWAFFAVVAVVAVAVGAAAAAGADRKKLLNLANAAIQEIGGLSDFHADFIRVTIEDQRGLAIDESRGLLMLIRGSQRKVVRFDQIISCEIREDNASLITTRRGVGGIVVGGLLGGEVGAIVGGIASPQYSTMTAGARSITLLVVTDELSNPNHVVTFLFGIGGAVVSKNSDAYRSGLANAQLWHSRITVAMRRAEEARSFARQPSISGQLSNSTAIQPLTTAMAPTVAIAPPTQQQPSNRVGERYEVVKQIGGGGMKKVFLAKDSRLGNRQCALAEMIDNLLTPDERKRAITAFQRECDLLATLDDPHIPKIYDHFSEQERHYLVMEYVQGKTLEQVSAENGASIDEDVVVLIALEVLATVSYLHNLNPPVLYRDLKPSNIMLTRDGGVKLIDFGIARHFQPTKTMTMIGTQGYAAPEQYSGKAEVRSDLYGLAAVMHQALSGRDPALYPPFSFPPIATLRPGLNAVLAKCIDHALWYDPTGRPASAAEMRERLLQIPRSTVSNKLIAFAQSRQVTESASADAPTAPAVLDSSDCGMELPPDSSESANCRISTTFQSVTETKPLPPSLPQPSKPVPMSVWFLVGGVTIAAGFVVLSLPAGTPHHSGPENAKSSTESASAEASRSSTDPTELNEKGKVETERKLLDSVRPLSSSDYAGNLKIYEQLLALRPGNAHYRQKVDTYRQMSERAKQQAPKSEPEPQPANAFDRMIARLEVQLLKKERPASCPNVASLGRTIAEKRDAGIAFGNLCIAQRVADDAAGKDSESSDQFCRMFDIIYADDKESPAFVESRIKSQCEKDNVVGGRI